MSPYVFIPYISIEGALAMMSLTSGIQSRRNGRSRMVGINLMDHGYIFNGVPDLCIAVEQIHFITNTPQQEGGGLYRSLPLL